ncbi:MAG: toll/interleukin-1 receptor domain-containing protein [Chloroflexota bacterium]|nr:toll/interleukin-1 receptor domain-containing protein [Chloroflexota bacterium]
MSITDPNPNDQLVPGSDPAPQHVFISYSRRDLDLVKKLIADLGKRGVSVWLDKQGLKPGSANWR